MKITLNLSAAASSRDRYALAWTIPVATVGLVVLVFLARASIHEYREYRTIQSQLVGVRARTAELRDQEASIRGKFNDPVNRDLLHRAKFVNNLIGLKELSLTEVSARIAGLLPEDAHLTGLSLLPPKKPGDDYSIRMGITARNEDAIETFVNDLEDSPDFKDVSILNQGFQEQSSQPDEVNIVCTARYLPGIDVATGKLRAEESTSNSKSNP
jgi:hypothetical protein